MALNAFVDSNARPMVLHGDGVEGILEALMSNTSPKNEEHFDSILHMAHLNPNLGSGALNSTILGRCSTSRTVESYLSLPVAFHNDNGVVSQLCRAGEEDGVKQRFQGSIVLKKQIIQNSLLVRRQAEPSILAPFLKRPRLDVIEENSQQQQQKVIQEVLLKELQGCNPQFKAMMNQQMQQLPLHRQLLHPPSRPHPRVFDSLVPKELPIQKTRVQGNQQETFAPLLDGGICSRRMKQYLYHMRSNTHDNCISYWKTFVSEYYALGSKKRWCFSRYENIELHTASVFCPKPMVAYCCQICGLSSGKGLVATYEVLPRLFKLKFENGMLDEILYIDSPQARKAPYGLVLEYGKAVQSSVYDTFRVVHTGKLHVAFAHDLKILSWEFCIENHEEYLLQSLFTPQVKQLDQAGEKYEDIQNRASSKASLLDLRRVCDMCVSAGIQIARNMELPLVNDLGYLKRFIRCLQISEVFDSMKELIDFSQETRMGAIECLNSYSRRRNSYTSFHTNGTISDLHISGSGLQRSVPCTRIEGLSSVVHMEQSLNSRESYIRCKYNEGGPKSKEMGAASKKAGDSESSNDATAQIISTINVLTASAFHSGKRLTVKSEPRSPELQSEVFLRSAAGFSNLEGFRW